MNELVSCLLVGAKEKDSLLKYQKGGACKKNVAISRELPLNITRTEE